MIAFYEGYIWYCFREFMKSIVCITELLKVCLCHDILVFYDREDYFIDDVRAMLGQKGIGIKKPP